MRLRLLSLILFMMPLCSYAESEHDVTINKDNIVIEGNISKEDLLDDDFLEGMVEAMDALDNNQGMQQEENNTTVIIRVEEEGKPHD